MDAVINQNERRDCLNSFVFLLLFGTKEKKQENWRKNGDEDGWRMLIAQISMAKSSIIIAFAATILWVICVSKRWISPVAIMSRNFNVRTRENELEAMSERSRVNVKIERINFYLYTKPFIHSYAKRESHFLLHTLVKINNAIEEIYPHGWGWEDCLIAGRLWDTFRPIKPLWIWRKVFDYIKD